MKATPLTDESLVLQALELESPEEQAAFLDRACGDNAELRSSVEELFRHHRAASGFLESPPTEVVAAADAITPHNQDHSLPPLHFLEPAAAAGSLGRLGHYEIEQVVGAGGFGVVLKARDTKLDRIVAVKTLAQSLASSAQARQRFVREAKAAAAVKHDNVVGIHAVSDEGPVPYLVMEFVSGVSLEEKVHQAGTLDLPAILRIGSQIASGLAAAHQQGLVHRDVKPANILLENGVERVKITDFGLARAASDATITREGEVAGTPQFMSPEQAQSQPLDSRSDLFSLGSVLYAACTGHSPFRAASAVAALRRVCDDTPRPIREINPEIPDWLVAIINRLLAKKPDERFQTAAEVADLLGQHLAELQHPGLEVKVRTRSQSKIQNSKSRIRLRPWAIAVAALVFVLLVGISLTEATGVTRFAPTLIRIVTGEGTLLVEVNDPAVKITVEGDGGLVITGAGLHEVNLKPGKYQLRADKDGQRVPLSQELVTITRGKQEVVRVRLESPATARPAAAVPAPEPQPFVILNGEGTVVRKFATLAEAVAAAADGDTIEIRGNGPFVTRPVWIESALRIRAAPGRHPIFQLSPRGYNPLLKAQKGLVLEGLEFQTESNEPDRKGARWDLVQVAGDFLSVANCRFLRRCDLQGQCIWTNGVGDCSIRNSQFVTGGYSGDIMYQCVPQGQLRLENCVSTGATAAVGLLIKPANVRDVSILMKRNTWVGSRAVWMWPQLPTQPPAGDARLGENIRLEAEDNVFDVRTTVLMAKYTISAGLTPLSRDLEDSLRCVLAWHDQRNLYAAQVPMLLLIDHERKVELPATQVIQSPLEWAQFWGRAETNCLQGQPRFQGGNLLARVSVTPEGLRADDYRLLAGSPGQAAGENGRDLGADVDLVGPGAAYERWKQTQEYQEWLKETAQIK